MTKIPSLSSRQLIAALKRNGAKNAPRRGKGSHQAFVRIDESNNIRLIIVPHPVKDLPNGTIRAILKQACLTVDELKKSL